MIQHCTLGLVWPIAQAKTGDALVVLESKDTFALSDESLQPTYIAGCLLCMDDGQHFLFDHARESCLLTLFRPGFFGSFLTGENELEGRIPPPTSVTYRKFKQ